MNEQDLRESLARLKTNGVVQDIRVNNVREVDGALVAVVDILPVIPAKSVTIRRPRDWAAMAEPRDCDMDGWTMTDSPSCSC